MNNMLQKQRQMVEFKTAAPVQEELTQNKFKSGAPETQNAAMQQEKKVVIRVNEMIHAKTDSIVAPAADDFSSLEKQTETNFENMQKNSALDHMSPESEMKINKLTNGTPEEKQRIMDEVERDTNRFLTRDEEIEYLQKKPVIAENEATNAVDTREFKDKINDTITDHEQELGLKRNAQETNQEVARHDADEIAKSSYKDVIDNAQKNVAQQKVAHNIDKRDREGMINEKGERVYDETEKDRLRTKDFVQMKEATVTPDAPAAK